MEGYTLKQLKGFKFEVIKDMFDKAFKRVKTFVDYKTELVEESSKRAEAKKESSSKREGEGLKSDNSKKQKIYDDQEEAEMKKLIEIVPEDADDIAIDAIPLATKPPIDFVRMESMHIYMLVDKRYPLKPSTIEEMFNKKMQADDWNEMCYQLLKLLTKQLKGSSRKRSRSPTTSVLLSSPIPGGLSSVRDDLLPPRKRIRSSEIVTNLEDCLNERSESSAKINECIAYPDTLRAERIDARVVVKAVAREEVKTNARGPVKVRVERVTHPMVSYDIPEPAQDEEL
ncbi:hypothetical protein Tco_1019975 [Tanacetum coccineum]|uniref:Uncharacterized protein n=1 Tax=Tanacetum coccineum TaxID=301880 RepID=A0ABQ5FYQ4_9ASTR